MGKGGSPEMVVNKYFLSQHFGICAQADAVTGIIIKEKPAWSGRVTTQSEIVVDRGNLFGGAEKEGGVEGVAHFLPGLPDQLLSNLLAQKLGRSSGADCPGYRGLASLFFTGPLGTANANHPGWNKRVKGKKGFYWTANNPYLPGVWVTVERAPIGLDPAIAMIGELGDDSEPEHAGPELVDGWTGLSDETLRIQLTRTTGGGSVAGNAIRFSIIGGEADGSTGLIVTRCYIGVRGATDFSFSGTPVQVTFNDGSAGVTLLPAEKVFCDWISLPFTADDEIVFAMHIGVGANSIYGYTNAGLGNWNSATKAGDDAATVDAVGYTGTPSHTLFFDDLFLGTLRGRTDANPAHMIFESLTNTDWGMGSPETAIDVDSFESAALTLYNENFGLSMIWTRQSSIQDFIQEILDHIQAVLFVDPATGLLTLKLIRGDYDPEALDEINPDNATLSSFGRKLWGEIANEIVVTWTNPENEQEETVTIQDLASIVTQGGIISDGRNYYGVRRAALAQQLAQRDLRSAGAPLASCEAEVDRTLWEVRPASLYRIVWPEYGLDGVVMRVSDVNYGKPGDPAIKLTLIEDVFGLDVGDYVEPPGSIWEDPSSAPEPLDHVLIFTMPYFMAVNTSVAAFIDTPEYPEVIAGVLGSTENTDTFNYELWDEVAAPDSSLEWEELATANVIGRAELVTAWDAEAETTFDPSTDLTEIFGQTSPVQGGFVIIGDGTEEESEIAMVTADGASVTVARGVLDTVPKAWPAGTPVWFVDDETLFEDPVIRAAGEEVSYRMLTRTSQGLLNLGSAPDVEYTLTERPWLPTRPANVTIDSVLFNTIDAPVDMTGESDVPVTWSNRNRLTEDSLVLAWTDGDVTPETGQTTTITIYAADGTTVLDTITGLSGTSHDIPVASFAGHALGLVTLSSERTDDDGTFASLQAHGIWVQVAAVTFDQTGITFDADTITWDAA